VGSESEAPRRLARHADAEVESTPEVGSESEEGYVADERYHPGTTTVGATFGYATPEEPSDDRTNPPA